MKVSEVIKGFVKGREGNSTNVNARWDVDGLALYSYNVCVAFWLKGVIYLTTEKYTATTSSHCNKVKEFARIDNIRLDSFDPPHVRRRYIGRR
jgi:hypothetical protein